MITEKASDHSITNRTCQGLRWIEGSVHKAAYGEAEWYSLSKEVSLQNVLMSESGAFCSTFGAANIWSFGLDGLSCGSHDSMSETDSSWHMAANEKGQPVPQLTGLIRTCIPA
jgi:hypothetical protein